MEPAPWRTTKSTAALLLKNQKDHFMKLYYSPGACSLSPHIALKEAGLAFEAIPAPTKTHKLPDGTDYYTINPLGYVPLLALDDGTQLREGPAIVQYIADQVPTKNLAPANGTLARYRLQEWLTFIGTEIHKGFSPLFNPATPDEFKALTRDKLASRLKWVDGQLANKEFLMGEHFTVADGYLFTVTNWAKNTGVDLSGFANLLAWRERIAARPAVQEAMKAEGLLK
jgi:glutathione S-transferase